MANELTALTEFSRALFRHAFIILPWFVKNFEEYRYKVSDFGRGVLPFIDALKKDKPLFFSNADSLARANQELALFFDTVKPNGYAKGNRPAVKHYRNAWRGVWKNRSVLQFRNVEAELMKLFYAVICKADNTKLPRLISMARLIDEDIVELARSIHLPGGWSTKNNLATKRAKLLKHKKNLFGRKKPTPENTKRARVDKPEQYKDYQKAIKEYKEAARLRIIEVFDDQYWHHVVNSHAVYKRLKKEKLDHFIPDAFKGRIGVQHTGYPLTFYTYAGLELEQPPINKVCMNENYGRREPGKDYQIHPVSDGTFYCQTSAVVGHAKCKHYTLEYKRRARKIKYQAVAQLEEVIENVRKRMLRHLFSKHRDTWVRALMCMFIDSKCARIGNTTSARSKNKTYGVTTLLNDKHVSVKEGRIIIAYIGKHNQPQKHVLRIYRTKKQKQRNQRASLIAQRMLELIQENNKHLFTRENGKPYTAKMVNEYFTADRPDPDRNLPQGGAGAPCTVHNIRNYHATRIFNELADDFEQKSSNPSYEDVLAKYQGSTRTNPPVKGILDKVAKVLQNTPAICRKAYINPDDQLHLFTRFGYRPPDVLINDLFVIDHDRYYAPAYELALLKEPEEAVPIEV